MPRNERLIEAGVVYHVLNRGNDRMAVFHKDADYQAFVDLMTLSGERVRCGPMRVLAYALMPNHFHLVLWPRQDGALSQWMQWLLTAHVRRYHRHYHGSGHVWQGRFKAFPIQQDEHLLTVLRYVERNPLRAKLVRRAENWPWSSLHWRQEKQRLMFLDEGPVPRPRNWLARVNAAETTAELEAVRRSIARGAPYGSRVWTQRAAVRLGLGPSLRPRGRPRKTEKK